MPAGAVTLTVSYTGYRISLRLELMFSVRNLLNAPAVQYSNEPGRLQLFDVYGSLWNFGLKDTF